MRATQPIDCCYPDAFIRQECIAGALLIYNKYRDGLSSIYNFRPAHTEPSLCGFALSQDLRRGFLEALKALTITSTLKAVCLSRIAQIDYKHNLAQEIGTYHASHLPPWRALHRQ
jgi:hypothetical protein